MSGPTPEDRAREAAEKLMAEGKPVTARTIAQLAGVRTSVATHAAREWKSSMVTQPEAPSMPDNVAIRFDAIWLEAYRAAHAVFESERTALRETLGQALVERDDLLNELAETEAARSQERQDAAVAAAAAERRLASETRLAERAKADAIKAEGQLAGLREAIKLLKGESEPNISNGSSTQ